MERETYERQHCTQSHANQWENGFKLNIPEFQRDLEPEEFLDWVLAIEEVFEFNEVPDYLFGGTHIPGKSYCMVATTEAK
jgi:hypothetical protein